MQALRYIREMSGLLEPVLDPVLDPVLEPVLAPRHPALTFTCL